MRRRLAIPCAILVASFLSAYFLYGSRAEEIATSASGRQVLLKDNGTWTYVD